MAVRRRTLVLIAAAVTLGLGLLIVAGSWWVIGTAAGRRIVQNYAQRVITGQLANGRVYIGTLHGSLFSNPSVDTLEIRDADDSVLVATGPVTLEFDALDLFNKRIVIRRLTVERPFVHLRHNSKGKWNFNDLLRERRKEPGTGRGFGSLVVVDSLQVNGGTFRWTNPWEPDAALAGAARDSAIKYHLEADRIEVRRLGDGFTITRSWNDIALAIAHARFAHPDSAGIALSVSNLDVNEGDPPLDLRNVRGTVAIDGDSVLLAITNFNLPGSSGRARGVITHKDGLGLAIRVTADTASFSDFGWLYPTFPKEGGGRLVLDILKRRDEDITHYAVTDMDIATTQSRLRGRMTFGVGGPVLAVTDVDLDAAPVDFKLFEVLSGEPFPLPWAGQLRGRVSGPGGPLDHWRVDSADIAFADGNVPGVVNRLRGFGELDMVSPALAAFHNFFVEVQRFDMRTIRALNADFPPLVGWIVGRARLDSVWTDVRFRDADISWFADTNAVSRVTGNGRVTVADELIYDLALVADPVSLDALRLSYPRLPVRGSYVGPFTVNGALGDLAIAADVAGGGGRVRADAQMDALEPGYGLRGHFFVENIDPSKVLVNGAGLEGAVTADLDAAITGDSIADLTGGVRMTIGRSQLGGFRFYSGRTNLAFGNGLMRADTLDITSSAGTIRGAGGLGLRADRRDSLRMSAVIDSLGGLRPFLQSNVDTTLAPDSLIGMLRAEARLVGNVDSLDVRLTATGSDVVYGSFEARHATLDADVRNARVNPVGTIRLAADTGAVAGVRLTHATAVALLDGPDSVRVTLDATSTNGPGATAAAVVHFDSAQVATRFDSMQVTIDDNRWRLLRPATIVSGDGAFIVDTMLFSAGPGTLRVAFAMPDSVQVRGALSGEAVPLQDLGKLLQVPIGFGGNADLTVALAGTQANPTYDATVRLRDARVGEARLEGLRAEGHYRDQSLTATLDFSSGGSSVLRGEATLPLDLSLRPVRTRLLERPLSATLTADSTTLSVAETITNAVTDVTGTFSSRIAIRGTWKRPRIDGNINVANGAFNLPLLGNLRWRDAAADVRFEGDTVRINKLFARSGGAADTGKVYGSLSITDLNDVGFDVRFGANNFRVINKRSTGDLRVTTVDPVRLSGRVSGSELTASAGVMVNGDIFIPDVARKDLISLDDPEFFRMVDTSVYANRRLLPRAPPTLVENIRVSSVRVVAGDNLWLRSEDANIKLNGALDVRVVSSTRSGERGQRQLGLEGVLGVERGQYRLNIGPLRRTFTVDTGTVRFFGDEADINPTVDISATYVVRQYDPRNPQPDVPIRVTIRGTVTALTARLSSPEAANLSEADLISYLATGAPSFEIGGRASDYTQTAARVAVTSLGSYIGSRLGGGRLDLFDVRTANLQEGYGAGSWRSIIASTRVLGGLQISRNMFLRADFGLCQLDQIVSGGLGAFDPVSLANTIGGKLDINMPRSLTASLGREPPTSALQCTQNITARGFIPTPGQWTLDFIRTWRW
jgi:translocation and assembly module TamB